MINIWILFIIDCYWELRSHRDLGGCRNGRSRSLRNTRRNRNDAPQIPVDKFKGSLSEGLIVSIDTSEERFTEF